MPKGGSFFSSPFFSSFHFFEGKEKKKEANSARIPSLLINLARDSKKKKKKGQRERKKGKWLRLIYPNFLPPPSRRKRKEEKRK